MNVKWLLLFTFVIKNKFPFGLKYVYAPMCFSLCFICMCLFIFFTLAFRLRTKLIYQLLFYKNPLPHPWTLNKISITCKHTSWLLDTLSLRLTCLVCKCVTFTVFVDIDGRMRQTMTTADRPIWRRRILVWSFCCNAYLGICFLCKVIVSTALRDESVGFFPLSKPYNTRQALWA